MIKHGSRWVNRMKAVNGRRHFSWLRRAVRANRKFKLGKPGSWKRGNKRIFRR